MSGLFRISRSVAIAALGLATVSGGTISTAARADSAPAPDPFSRYSDPASVVLAVRTNVKEIGGRVRLSVFDRADTFLETPASKHEGSIAADGIAILDLGPLPKGDYAFVAYYDKNRDGKLNRSFIGLPKEPFAFSNGVKPKLSKPEFKDAKVDVAPGSVVVLTIED